MSAFIRAPQISEEMGIMSHRQLRAARAEALFTSHLPTGSRPARAQVEAVIRSAVKTYGGSRGCATVLAGAYGDYPETAAPRMRWALAVVEEVYRKSVAAPGQHWSLRTRTIAGNARSDRHEARAAA
jgi:hypothetical protein